MAPFDVTQYREHDLLHRLLQKNAPSQPGVGPVYGDSVNLPDIFYVDSDNGNDVNDGRDPAFPKATIDSAIGSCTTLQNDVILVQPGHSEELTAAIELDVIGVQIIGVGEGTLRPQITLAADDNGIEVSVVNCRIENIYFNERTVTPTGVNAYIDVSAANCKILNCHFDVGADDLDSITLAAGADSCEIANCRWVTTAQGPNSAIRIESTIDLLHIHHNFIDGGTVNFAFDEGHIVSGSVHTNCLIEYNTFHAIVSGFGLLFTANATGIIQYNTFGLGTLGSMLDPGVCMCFQNFEQDVTGESGILTPDINPAGSVGGGAHGGINDTETDTMHGKLGRDTDYGDSSLWEMLVSSTGTGVVSWPSGLPYGAGESFAEVIAYIQDGIRRGSGTILEADVSLWDVLGGTKGMLSWPSASRYAGGISIAEVLGYVQDSVATDSGARIPGLGTQLVRPAGVDLHAGSATVSAFTVGTGRILLMGFIVEITVANIDAGALTFRFQSNPTVGSASNLCANLDINGFILGTLMSIDGVVGTALLTSTTASSVLLMPNAQHGIVIPPGTIDAVASADGTGSGGSALEITAYWIPLDTGATLVTA